MPLSSINRPAIALLCLSLPVWADITGTVKLKGDPPVTGLTAIKYDTEVCGDQPRPLRVLSLGTNQTVAGAIVYLGTPPLTGMTNEVARLELRDCELVPRVQVAKNPVAVLLKNSDPLLHVVRLDLLTGTNAPQTLAMVAAPYAGFEKRIALPTMKEPALLRISGLNGHEWLTAYVAVLPFQWTTLSDTNGQFALTVVRPGAYKIYAWHEALGTLASEVKVASNRTANVELEFTTVAPTPSD